ncbi:MAG TPA: hypothetical protein VKV74_16555 [Bryobacteraceae bacterium]|nr:hypothetical protein [Bryobacteraceae bacterium]
MTSREQTMWVRLALGAMLAAALTPFANAQAPAAAPAQGQGRGQGRGRGAGGRAAAPLYTPAPGAKDLKSVLFNWAWYMGMLRSSEERDLIMTLEYQGKGVVQLDGQPCNVSKYRTSISYQTSGERIQYVGARPNGQSCSNVEVLSGAYAWNEDIPGAELVPGKGKATPMPGAVEERMIRLWASPQGAFKGAMAGISDPPEMAPRPQRVPADVSMAGKTSVSWDGNKPTVTFPIPGVPNAIAAATLNDKFMAERVVVKHGAKTYEFDYSDYKDWNNPLNPAEAFYAGRMIEKQNGVVVRDIATTLTETGQMYVVMPVPASVRAAIKPTNQPPKWTLNVDAPPRPAPTETAAVATPRLPDGHPDMTGNWTGPPLAITGGGNRRCGPTQTPDGGINPGIGCKIPMDNFWVDYEWISPSRFGLTGDGNVPSHPVYKPEFWDKIQELDQWTNKYDPIMTCQPMGMPREGTPARIIQSPTDIIFFYTTSDYGGGNIEFRDIPTDGRARPNTVEAYYNGLSIGHWEGDTLVIDSTNFVDTTWLGRGGLLHSANMHIIEKLTRKGNEILYQETIEDPDDLLEPWVMPDKTLRLRAGAPQLIHERANCEVYEEGNISTQLRH